MVYDVKRIIWYMIFMCVSNGFGEVLSKGRSRLLAPVMAKKAYGHHGCPCILAVDEGIHTQHSLVEGGELHRAETTSALTA
jgi:hypothetical protein